MLPRAFLLLGLLAAASLAPRASAWADGSEETSGNLAITGKGLKIVLNPSTPKCTVVSTGDACGDGSGGCKNEFLLTSLHKLYEADAAGARINHRDAGDVLDLSQGSWQLAELDLSDETVPPQNVSAATFTAPFKPAGAIHACSPAATFATAAPQRFFQFTVMLFGADGNYTAAGTDETVEVLAGNVKTTMNIGGWPFCSPSNFLVAELAFKSSKLGKPDAPRPPTVLNGSEVEEAARELRQTLYEAADAEEEDDEESAPPARRLLGKDSGKGSGGKPDSAGVNSDGNRPANSTESGSSGGSRPKMNNWEAVEEVDRKLKGRLANSTRARLEDKVAKGRATAGLGRRADPRRLVLALPGAGAVDAKLDVPSVAMIDGANTTIAVDAPKFSQGEGVQRVRLSFPAFSDLSYDPTSAFSTSDAALDEQLQSALGDAPKSGAVAARAAAHAAALLGCLASAALLA